MKLRKVLSSVVAGAIAVSAMAISSSATLKVVDQDGHFRSGTNSWMPVIYSDGTFDASEKDPTDYGIDCTQIGSVEVTITPDDPEWFDGSFGGAIVLSSKSEGNEAHNWNGKEFWGTVDEDVEEPINTVAADKPVVFVKTGDYTYTGTMMVDDSNCVFENPHLVQIAIQEWGQNMCDMVVKSMVVKDKSGNVMISFDENGKADLPLLDASAAADDADDAEADDDADADDADADTDDADADDADADDDDDDDDDVAPAETTAAPAETTAAPAETTAAPAETTAAPAETTAAPAETQAPAAGNVAAATDSSKGSPDTGVADVAAVAGLAIVAGGAVLVAKKRK